MKTSRSMTRPLTPVEIRQALLDELSRVAIFHPEPLHIVLADDTELYFPLMYGGFSQSLFNRGEACVGCGRCCVRFRPIWLWAPGAPGPDHLPEFTCLVNGVRITFRYHLCRDQMGQCEYLEDVPGKVGPYGQPLRLCSLHGEDPSGVKNLEYPKEGRNFDLKPIGCRFTIFVEPKKVNTRRGLTFLLSRRLPSRNFRWPKCPVDVYNLLPSREVFNQDLKNLLYLEKLYGNLPGSNLHWAINTFEETANEILNGHTLDENIYFEDLF